MRSLYQRGRLYFSLARERRLQRISPLVVNLFITGRCNADCAYCYVGMDENPAREFTLDEWRSLIDGFIARGARMFTIVGGEPLLSPNCAGIVEHLRRRGMFFTLTSNGYLIPRHLSVARLASQLTLSVDGDERSNDDIRGEGAYHKTLKGIRAAREAGIPVRLSVVVTKGAMGQTAHILELCDRYNMFATFTPCIDPPSFRTERTARLRMTGEEVREYFRGLLAWKGKSARIMNSEASIRYMINYPLPFSEIIMRDSPHAGYYPPRCPYGVIQFIVTNTGAIYPCGIWWNRADFTPGNVLAEGLDAALARAHDLPCQSCSFCNLVDWVELAKPSAVVRGLDITARQFLRNRLSPRHGEDR